MSNSTTSSNTVLMDNQDCGLAKASAGDSSLLTIAQYRICIVFLRLRSDLLARNATERIDCRVISLAQPSECQLAVDRLSLF